MLCWPGWMGAGSRQGHTTAASLISKDSLLFFRILRPFSEEYEPWGILRAIPGAVRPIGRLLHSSPNRPHATNLTCASATLATELVFVWFSG